MWRNTTLIGGQTSATVTFGGQLVGTYHQTNGGLMGDADGAVLGVVAPGGTGRQLTWTTPDTVLRGVHDELLAEFVIRQSWGKTPMGRKIAFLSIVRFAPEATVGTRALALTRPICDQVQHEKDMDFADRAADWGD